VPYDWNELVGYDFLRQAREVTVKHGSALIFDQILTGFRLGIDGAQGFFDVIPDLTTYGKAIANGYPLAVVGGVKPLMHMFDQVMITTTHAGETLSLAAAMATLKTMQDEPVFDRIRASGQRLQQGFDSLSARHGLKEAKSFGLPVAPQLRFSSDDQVHDRLKTRFDRYLFENGVFPSSPYLINYAHSVEDIDATLEVMDTALANISD
ncbi:MAG: aminotransferase class III-fold pyridoxal phosphate-dependent enzyme, partial [Rhodothermales bacterium]|nr:aminotransferase class III-fold pyridoxal phosphate-dependent enzyme [Rhodothermales bacterium]